MSMWSSIAHILKEIYRKMIGAKTIESTLRIAPTISSQMENAIQLWADMYGDKSPWLHEPTYEDPSRVVSLGLPAMIASEKARTALIEFVSEITTPMKEVEVENPNYSPAKPDELGNVVPTAEPKTIMTKVPIGDTKRAEFLNIQYSKLLRDLRKQIEYGIAKGGLVVKPYIVIEESDKESGQQKSITIEFDYVQADAFYPITFDASKRIIEAAFVQTKTEKDILYRRLEYHKWEKNTVTIINKAFKSTNSNASGITDIDLGHEIPLTDVPEWSALQPQIQIKNVNRPLFAYFRVPEANTIDTNSPLGVSGFSRAVKLIRDADVQYSRLLWEYEAGEIAINVDRDAFTYLEDPQGNQHTVLGHMQNRLYRRMDITNDELFEPFAPALRDANYTEGLNTILMRIEDVCTISRGTLSDSIDIARTATELKILKQRSYQANVDIQKAIQSMLEDVIYVMNVYCTLYNITPPGDYDVSFAWDDSLIIDIDAELEKRIVLQQNGIVSKVENRMWYFGETEQQATEAITKIDEEQRKAVENDLIRDTNEIMKRRQAGEFSQRRNYDDVKNKK